MDFTTICYVITGIASLASAALTAWMIATDDDD